MTWSRLLVLSWVLALLSGGLAFAAYPRIGWWPLIFVAYAPLMVALDGQSAKRRFLLGWACGIVFTVGMQYWIVGTLIRMSGFSSIGAVGAFVVYTAYIALLHGLFSVLYSPVRRWSGRYGWIVTIPILYALIERLFPALFPFFVCSALYEYPVLLQTTEWVGPSGGTVLVLLCTTSLVQVVEDMSRGRASDHVAPTAVVALWLMASVWGGVRMQEIWEAPLRGEPTVALIQPNVTTQEKRARDKSVREEVFDRTAAMTRTAISMRPSLVVWPEGGFPYNFEADAPEQRMAVQEPQTTRYSRALYKLALELGRPLAVGARRVVDGRTRNAALFFESGGQEPLVYDKRELLLFSETVPFADTFPALRDAVQGMSHDVAGSSHAPFEAAGFQWVPGICHEATLPDFTRKSLQGGGDVLLNFTNDVWFGDTAAAEHHLMLQIQRTIENRVWLVRSTNSGISAMVDPTGTVRGRSNVGRSAILARAIGIPTLHPSLYRRFGDALFILTCILAALWLLLRNWRALGNFWRARGVKGQTARAARRGQKR